MTTKMYVQYILALAISPVLGVEGRVSRWQALSCGPSPLLASVGTKGQGLESNNRCDRISPKQSFRPHQLYKESLSFRNPFVPTWPCLPNFFHPLWIVTMRLTSTFSLLQGTLILFYLHKTVVSFKLSIRTYILPIINVFIAIVYFLNTYSL